MSKTKNTEFTYGGYTFEALGTFEQCGVKDELMSILAALCYTGNDDLVADGDEPFDYDAFYKAAGEQENDVYRCKENGVNYVPCGEVLPIFAPHQDHDSVKRRAQRRRQEIEDSRREARRAELANAMCPTEEGHQAIIALGKAIERLRELGFDFAHEGETLYALRTDLLTDITDNMCPMEGQESITANMLPVIHGVWNATDGLYANVRK